MQDDNVVKNDVNDVVEVDGVVDVAKARQLAMDVATATESYERNGEPDLENEHRQRAQALGISDAALTERWRKAKANWRLAAQAKRKAEAEPPRPKRRLLVIPDEGPPKTEAAQIVSDDGHVAATL